MNEDEKSLVETSSEIKQHARETSQELRQQVGSRAEEWRDGMMDAVDRVAKALDAAATSLRDNQAWLAEPASKAAHQIESFATNCRSKSLTEIKNDFEDLARRNPALLMGGAIALGFVASRLLKSASPHARSGDDVASRRHAAMGDPSDIEQSGIEQSGIEQSDIEQSGTGRSDMDTGRSGRGDGAAVSYSTTSNPARPTEQPAEESGRLPH